MCEKKDSVIDQIEMQLHEQYAINHNESINSFIAFLSAVLAIFSAFGYIFVHTKYQMSDGGTLFINKEFTFEVYVGVALITTIILAFLAEFSLSLGFAQRHDQVIIQRIRHKHYQEKYKEIFKDSYKADNKTICDYIPDIYNIFYVLFIIAQLLIIVATIYQCCQMHWEYCICWILLVIQIAIMLFILHRRCCHYYCKYQKIQ